MPYTWYLILIATRSTQVAYRCDICGKTKQFGHNVSFSQRKTNRTWKPNLQVKRLPVGDSVMKLKVCAQCLRTLKKPAKSTTKPAQPTTSS